MEEQKRILRVRNKHGVKVKRCCLSCQYKTYDEKEGRYCSKMMIKLGKRFYCKLWEMADEIKKVGDNKGRVKTKAYLNYVKNIRLDEMESIRLGILKPEDCRTIADIRKEYLKEHESIYFEN